MSRYIPKLKKGGRNGVSWPPLSGTWQQDTEATLLSMFADNLDVPQIPSSGDLLNSVPVPWARLLLFESALFKSSHPSHRDVQDQWRGMLGLIALAAPLGLKFDPLITVDLQQYSTEIAKTFLDLRPQYYLESEIAQGVFEDRWSKFQLLSVNGKVLGATSPRTLVFTGVGHSCPSSIPFSVDGRLSDPAHYYRRFEDLRFLGILAHWLNGLITKLQNNAHLTAFLGQLPTARGAGHRPRISLLLERLEAWRAEMGNVEQIPINDNQTPVFTLPNYSFLTGLSPIQTGQSDLYLRDRDDTIVCYRAHEHSKIFNASESELQGDSLLVYDGHWARANNPLPAPLSFIPSTVRRLENPEALFEERLIEVQLPDNPEAVYYLEEDGIRYLFPFKSEILDYLSAEEISRYTQITKSVNANKIRVELKLPLANTLLIKTWREYSIEDSVILGTDCDRLAKWPDFVCPTWHRYFYFKNALTSEFLNFTPLGDVSSRRHGKLEWYVSEEPVQAFAGQVGTFKGLLLLREVQVQRPTRYWQVSVDFGSTHTRAFSLEVDKQEQGYFNNQRNVIRPITFKPRAKLLTAFDETDIISSFFDFGKEEERRAWLDQEELATLLMQPMPNAISEGDWLPREGFVYKRSVLATLINPENLRQDLKWNSNREDFDLRAFLRCLLLMTQAEACATGAQVVSIAHTHPSVFTAALASKHKDEWFSLQEYLNSGRGTQAIKINVLPIGDVTETVAVCKHLENDQGAAPNSNTISLDVGGSTTDMAVWGAKVDGFGGELKIQESVKTAAGIVGQYLDKKTSRTADTFLNWLVETVNKKPYEANINLRIFENRAGGYGLMFNTVLSTIERNNLLPNFIDRVNAAPEALPLLAHIIYLFSGLTYYAGLLARKALPEYSKQSTYYIYFCGRGGQLVKWIRGYQQLISDMFIVGLYRNGEFKDHDRAQTVDVRISSNPKEEVGRGLLAENALEGNPNKRLGLSSAKSATVTVGDTGYRGLDWNGTLSPDELNSLPANVVPSMHELKELSAFLTVFRNNEITREAAKILGLIEVDPSHFQANLKTRLFGAGRGNIIVDLRKYADDALLEPLFITEMKVLLETATQNPKIFR